MKLNQFKVQTLSKHSIRAHILMNLLHQVDQVTKA